MHSSARDFKEDKELVAEHTSGHHVLPLVSMDDTASIEN